MVLGQGLTFDDVLIIPKYSDIESRSTIDITTEYLGRKRIPIISAPMDYVTGLTMAKRMHELNAYGIISRFGQDEDGGYFPDHEMGMAVGVNTPWDELRNSLYKYSNLHSVTIDVAHGDHQNVIDLIKRLKDYSQGLLYIIAGNVATANGFAVLQKAGADAIRVGIGAGSACSTRENTGIGVPQLTAIMDCAEVGYTASLIADGGIQTPGDIAKALAAGADAVMLGRMLAGHDENPGEVFSDDRGVAAVKGDSGWKLSHDIYKYKKYRGQSIFGSNATRGAPEGVEGTVPYRGPVDKTVESLVNYLKSSFSYVGARNIEEFRQRAEFIQVSPATIAENRTRL